MVVRGQFEDGETVSIRAEEEGEAGVGGHGKPLS